MISWFLNVPMFRLVVIIGTDVYSAVQEWTWRCTLQRLDPSRVTA